MRARAEEHAGGGAGADLEHRRQRVLVVHGPLAGAAPPAELGAARHVAHARRPVPGRAEVPLHVRVVGEDLPLRVHGDVVLVAVSAADDLDVRAVGIAAGDPPARRHAAAGVTASVPEPREEQVLVPVRRRAGSVELRGVRVVAGDEVETGPVERRHHGVRPMLAAVAEGDDVRRVVELAVAVGVADAPDPLTVHVGVERVEGPGHPLGAAHVDGEPFDGRHGRGVADGRGLDPEEALAALVAGEQRSVRAVGQGDPRALHLVGHAVERLATKPSGRAMRSARRAS